MCGGKHRAGSDSEKLSLLLSLATEKEEKGENTQIKTLTAISFCKDRKRFLKTYRTFVCRSKKRDVKSKKFVAVHAGFP